MGHGLQPHVLNQGLDNRRAHHPTLLQLDESRDGSMSGRVVGGDLMVNLIFCDCCLGCSLSSDVKSAEVACRKEG